MSSELIRATGINSGLDTESIISAYTSTASKRVQEAKNGKQINEWTQDAWKDMNSKIYSFYSKTLSTNRLASAYSKTKVTTSNDALSVVAGDNAVMGVQTAQIKETAKAAYLTGSKVAITKGTDNLSATLGIAAGQKITYMDKSGVEQTIQIGGEATDGATVVNTMDELVNALKKAGVNANYDTENQRLFLSAKNTGTEKDFSLGGDLDALQKLGLATKAQGGDAVKIDGADAKLILNGAEFTSNTNSFNINGSTYTINYLPENTDEQISVTTGRDYDAVYDVVKDMMKEYNNLVNEMSKLYNAASAKGYDPLTDEQKEAMTESQIEDWEEKIKGALLRNDDTLYDVLSVMSNTTTQGFEVNGKKMYLSDFGISTMGYFEAEENERYALHIDGDEDDSNTASKANKLKAMIASDPEAVTSFFQQLSQSLYTNLYSKMGSTKLSSIYKVYNDKQLDTEHDEWTKKIAELEQKLTDMEDRYYAQFSQMEVALSKMNSNQSAVSSMLGM